MINFLKCYLIFLVFQSSSQKVSDFSDSSKNNISVERDIFKYPKKFEKFTKLPYVASNSLISRSDLRLKIVANALIIHLLFISICFIWYKFFAPADYCC